MNPYIHDFDHEMKLYRFTSIPWTLTERVPNEFTDVMLPRIILTLLYRELSLVKKTV